MSQLRHFSQNVLRMVEFLFLFFFFFCHFSDFLIKNKNFRFHLRPLKFKGLVQSHYLNIFRKNLNAFKVNNNNNIQ